MCVNTSATLVVFVVVVIVIVDHAFLRECAMGILGKYVIQNVRDVTQDVKRGKRYSRRYHKYVTFII